MGEQLGKELFKAVETEQGYAYISDAVEELDDARVLEVARQALLHSIMVTIILKKFLSKHKKRYRK